MMCKIKTLYSRTLLLRAMACGLILTVLLNLAGFSAQCAALEENIVRLHVIANSNDEADQAVKLRVRDAVLREAEQWYGDAEDFDTAVTALCTHLESLEAAANSVLKAENLPYCAKADESFFSLLLQETRRQAVLYPNFLRPMPRLSEPLSPAETQVLRLLCGNRSNQEIADILGVKVATVKTHVIHILQKLGVKRRGEAKEVAQKLHIIEF